MDNFVVAGSSLQEEKMDDGRAGSESLWGSEQVKEEDAFPAGVS